MSDDDDYEIHDQITKIVVFLMVRHQTKPKLLARAAGMKPRQLTRSLRGSASGRRPWLAVEVVKIADAYQVPIAAFYGDAEAIAWVVNNAPRG